MIKRIYSTVRQTPMMKQYERFQSKYPDHVILMQVGSFYEVYGRNVERIGHLLGLRIANMNNDGKTKAVGFPLQSLKEHISCLLNHGQKITIVEQKGKDSMTGLISRSITRVVTPGTLIDVDEAENNFLLSLSLEKNNVGMAWLDVSTGDFILQKSTLKNLVSDVKAIQPKEIIVNENLKSDKIVSLLENANFNITFQPENRWSCKASTEKLASILFKDQIYLFEKSTDVLDSREKRQVSAGVALLSYVDDVFPEFKPLISPPIDMDEQKFLKMDSTTISALEVLIGNSFKTRKGSLISIIDKTRTAGGKRLLAQRLARPSICIDEINEWHDLVETFTKDLFLLDTLKSHLKECKDIERCVQKLYTRNGGAREFQFLLTTLEKAREIRKILPSNTSLNSYFDDFSDLLKYSGLISDDPTLLGSINSGFSQQLDNLYDEYRKFINEKETLKSKLCSDLDITVNLLDVDEPICEIRTTSQKKQQEIRNNSGLNIISRRQKSAHSIHFIDERWTRLFHDINQISSDIRALDSQIFQAATEELLCSTKRLMKLSKGLGILDVACGFADVANEMGYVRPIMTEEMIHKVDSGRHPVVEHYQNLRDNTFVVNDSDLSLDKRFILLTGPNMGGKSTYLRQCAIFSILAQSGCFVPAKRATLGIVDSIYTRIGASDDLSAHQSTFMTEMAESANIVHNATTKSMVIMDEVGRGTSNKDGIALAYGITKYLHDKNKSLVLFATHYHELVDLVQDLDAIEFYQSKSVENHSLYKIVPGVMDKSHGIRVAEMAGIPAEIVDTANEIYKQL